MACVAGEYNTLVVGVQVGAPLASVCADARVDADPSACDDCDGAFGEKVCDAVDGVGGRDGPVLRIRRPEDGSGDGGHRDTHVIERPRAPEVTYRAQLYQCYNLSPYKR